ncbi:MAG: HD-GYP domain-containing protein [Wujia sp.]
MFEFKLQLGCLIVVLYFTIVYIKQTYDRKVACNKLFDALLIAAPWAIIFDGLTAWTVNHMDTVPGWINMAAHGIFFVLMDLVNILIFVYMVHQMVGIKNKKELFLILLPGIISIAAVLITMKDLYFIEGKTTAYSMGLSVIICFASLFLHYFMIIALLCIKHRNIERHKIFSIVLFMVISGCVLVAQIIYPELLITSLVPMLFVVGLYMNFENPALIRLKQYNADMVTGFATLVENRDNNTGGHIRRTKGYVEIIIDELKRKPEYARILTKDYIENVINAAPMHDIGKISTPDHILQKPGKLTAEEYEIMKQHSAVGGNIIKETFADLDEPEYQQIAYEVARFHHEKWNGKGYPDGLRGEEIPLHARIMAIADVFDAVSAKRCYRDAMPIEKCFKIIEEGSGEDFDPELATIFLNAREKVLAYYNEDKERRNKKIQNENI